MVADCAGVQLYDCTSPRRRHLCLCIWGKWAEWGVLPPCSAFPRLLVGCNVFFLLFLHFLKCLQECRTASGLL